MINLLKFREGEDPKIKSSAVESFGKYSVGIMPLLEKYGGSISWVGYCKQSVIAPEGEN